MSPVEALYQAMKRARDAGLPENAEAVKRALEMDGWRVVRPDTTGVLVEALERIAAMDYRGNEPSEHYIARTALDAHRAVR